MEKIIESISPFGRFQKLATVLIGAVSSLTAMLVYSIVFTTARPKFSCNRRMSLNISDIETQTSSSIMSESNTCEIWKLIQSNNTVIISKSEN